MRKILAYALLVNLMLISSCFLDQYQDNRSVTLRLKFPSVQKSSSGVLAKPADADATYIPPFIDKIEFSLKGEDFEFTETRTRSDGNLSTEYDLGVLPWGQYEIEANAYICKCTEMDTCANCDDSDPYNDEYTLTHKFSNPALVIASGYENYQIDLGMDVNYTTSGTAKSGVALDRLDSNTIKITPNIDFFLNPSYGLTVNDMGDFALVWAESSQFPPAPDFDRLRAKVFDSHGKQINDTLVAETTSPATLSINADPCAFLATSLLAFFTTGTDKVPLVKKLDFLTSQEPTTVLSDFDDGVDLSAIASSGEFAVIAWKSTREPYRMKTKTLWFDNQVLATSDGITLNSIGQQSLTQPKVKFLNENRFILTARDALKRIQGGIFGEDGKTLSESKILIPDFGYDYFTQYSIDQTESGFSLIFDVTFSSYLIGIFRSSLDSNLNITQTSPSKVFANNQSMNNSSHWVPAFFRIRDDGFLMAWLDNYGNAGQKFSVYYSLPDQSNFTIDKDSYYPSNIVSQTNYSISATHMKIAINKDGFAVISWFYEDSIYIRRFIF